MASGSLSRAGHMPATDQPVKTSKQLLPNGDPPHMSQIEILVTKGRFCAAYQAARISNCSAIEGQEMRIIGKSRLSLTHHMNHFNAVEYDTTLAPCRVALKYESALKVISMSSPYTDVENVHLCQSSLITTHWPIFCTR